MKERDTLSLDEMIDKVAKISFETLNYRCNKNGEDWIVLSSKEEFPKSIGHNIRVPGGEEVLVNYERYSSLVQVAHYFDLSVGLQEHNDDSYAIYDPSMTAEFLIKRWETPFNFW